MIGCSVGGGRERGNVTRRDVVVIGASAGGVEALRDVVGGLPRDFPAAVLVVLHVPPYGGSALPAILERAGPLAARHARDGDELVPGRILIAPPDRHLLVAGQTLALSAGPRENGHRPAVDTLFRSAARHLGRRAVAVVLSGVLDDGTAGVDAVRRRGGIAVVQDPADALYPGMPRSAQPLVDPAHVLPAREIPALLVALVAEELGDPADPVPSPLLDLEARMAEFDLSEFDDPDRPGRPSGFSCPDCHGVLFTVQDDVLTRFRCRVGHAWSAESLAAQQSLALEAALWMALRSLEERAALARELATRAAARHQTISARRFASRAEETDEAARVLRELLTRISPGEEAPAVGQPGG